MIIIASITESLSERQYILEIGPKLLFVKIII